MKNITVKTFAIKHIGMLIAGIVMAFVTSGITIAVNDLIADTMDCVTYGKSVDVSESALLIGVMAVAGGLATFLNVVLIKKYGLLVQTDFKAAAARRLPEMEYRYLDEKGSGEILNHLISDIKEMDAFFSVGLPEICTSIIVLVVTIGYMFVMDWRLALVIIVIYPLLLFFANNISNRVKNLAKQRRSKLDERTEIAYDSVQGIVVCKSYNLEEELDRRIGTVIEEVFKNERQRTSVSSLSHVLEATIGWLPVVICYIIALFEVLNGIITTGQMLVFSVLLGVVSRNAENIPVILIETKESLVSVARLNRLMAVPVEQSGDYVGDGAGQNAPAAISLKNVEFTYTGNDNYRVLKGVTMEIANGSKCAIIGSSGGGKTTVFKLLTGYYTVEKGSYELYGKNFEDWDLAAARNLFALVSQNVFLLPESIESNVAYGNLKATKQEIIQACKNANIHDFIMSLPNQYETEVGERGVRLSGGERQRISLARAFLKNAPILLLDEPTASIDVGTEELIQEAIERISEGKTVITIAHRLNTVIGADKIFVLDNGVIAEQGTHLELMERKGVYYTLYGKQQKADTEDKEAADAAE